MSIANTPDDQSKVPSSEDDAVIDRAIRFIDTGSHTQIARDTMINELRKLLTARRALAARAGSARPDEVERLTLELQNQRELTQHWKAQAGYVSREANNAVKKPEQTGTSHLAAYDPSVQWAKQRVRLTLKQWAFTAVLETTVAGNCQGFTILESAVCNAWEQLPTRRHGEFEYAFVTLTRADGETLECEDDELGEEDWLKSMVIGVEIIAQEPETTSVSTSAAEGSGAEHA